MKKCFKYLFLFFSLATFFLLSTTFPLVANEQDLQANTVIPHFEKFANLQRIGVIVRTTSWYNHVMSCHGKEEQCADEALALKLFPDRRKDFITSIKKWFEKYPSALRKEALEQAYLQSTTDEIGKFISAPSKQAVLLSNEEYEAFAKDEGALIITLRVFIDESTDPWIALLTVDMSRSYKGCGSSCTYHFVPQILAIPLNMNEEDITERVNSFTQTLSPLAQGAMTFGKGN